MVEQHTALRFARLSENAPDYRPPAESAISRLITVTYNVAWWMPILLALVKVIDYRTGSTAFLAITVIRAMCNAYRANHPDWQRAIRYPLRAP